MELKQRFISAIAFCLAQDKHDGDLEKLAAWALTSEDYIPAPGDASLKIALIAGGATKIKGYVFESARLPEIRGASGLLDRINLTDVPSLFGTPEELDRDRWDGDRRAHGRQVRLAFQERHGMEAPDCPECVIYANGGEILAFAPVGLAPQLADEIERVYTRETLVAQSVAVWREFELRQLRDGLFASEREDGVLVERLLGYNPAENKTFGGLVAALTAAKLRRREANPDVGRSPELRAVAHFETVPFARRCSSCELRAASVLQELPDGQRPLCEACARKRTFGQLAKREAPKAPKSIPRHNREFNWKPGPVRSWADEFMHAHPEVGNVAPPEDLGEIGAAAQPEGFVGVIYADGNNMRGLIEKKLKTATDYREFAEQVYAATKGAVFDAIAASFGRQSAPYPFEILSIGGDDLFLIVPAHTALPVACDIAKMVEDRLRGERLFEVAQGYEWPRVQRCAGASPSSQCEVSLSVGVVLADAHTPVFYLEDLASQLLKTAKRRAKRLKREHGYYGGTVDFLALKSVTMITGSVEQFRAAALTRNDERLYARPYTVAEMELLLESVRRLKAADFPRSQLYRLRESLRSGRGRSTVDYLYFLSRGAQGRGADLRETRREIEGFWTSDNQPQPHPWRSHLREHARDEHNWETVWLDIAELYDFVPDDFTPAGGEAHADH